MYMYFNGLFGHFDEVQNKNKNIHHHHFYAGNNPFLFHKRRLMHPIVYGSVVCSVVYRTGTCNHSYYTTISIACVTSLLKPHE